MTTFQFAVEPLTASRNRVSCAPPRNVWFRLLIASLQVCETGLERDGTIAEKKLRVLCGAVGARSGWPVSGLSHLWFADAFALRNERSSRKKISRFLPQRKLR